MLHIKSSISHVESMVVLILWWSSHRTRDRGEVDSNPARGTDRFSQKKCPVLCLKFKVCMTRNLLPAYSKRLSKL